jgi:hypothetical protein
MIFPRKLYVVVSVDCWRLDSTHHAYRGEVLALRDDEASDHGDHIVPLRLDPEGLADLLDRDAVEALAKLLLPALKAKLEPAPEPAVPTRRRARAAV